MRCEFYSTQRLELFENLEKVEPNFLGLSVKDQVLVLLYGSQTSNSESLNQEIIKNVISYLKATTRFDKPLIVTKKRRNSVMRDIFRTISLHKTSGGCFFFLCCK